MASASASSRSGGSQGSSRSSGASSGSPGDLSPAVLGAIQRNPLVSMRPNEDDNLNKEFPKLQQQAQQFNWQTQIGLLDWQKASTAQQNYWQIQQQQFNNQIVREQLEADKNRLAHQNKLTDAQAALTLAQARLVDNQAYATLPVSSPMGPVDANGFRAEDRRRMIEEDRWAAKERERKLLEMQERQRQFDNSFKQQSFNEDQRRFDKNFDEDKNRFWARFNEEKMWGERNFAEDQRRFNMTHALQSKGFDLQNASLNAQIAQANRDFAERARQFDLSLAEQRASREQANAFGMLQSVLSLRQRPSWMSSVPIVV